jgi:hypothetical protein
MSQTKPSRKKAVRCEASESRRGVPSLPPPSVPMKQTRLHHVEHAASYWAIIGSA